MSKLLAAVNKAKQTGSTERNEDYFYYPARDAAGNGSAVIRFLPGTTDAEDDIPFVKIYSHGFQNKKTNKWFIDNCLTTIDQDCPVCEENSKLYASMSKDDARKFGMNRKTSFISRILVVEDKKNPENEGKVFLFKYGSIIFDKISDALCPEDDETKFNVFNTKGEEGPWPVFKFKIRKVDNQTNYDKSTFDESSEGADVDFRKQYTPENEISKFIAGSQFKTKEQLKKRLDLVMGNTVRMEAAEPSKAVKEADEMAEVVATKVTTKSKVVSDDDDDDDVMALVQRLANED